MTARTPECRRTTAQERREKVTALTRAGLSAPKIAVKMGITTRSVERIRKQCGLTKPAPPPLSPEELATAKALLDDGASRKEAARTIGRSKDAVARAFPGRCWTHAEKAEYQTCLRQWQKVLAS